ncbi:MAG: hypothetical protein WC209_16440 [Ignavibacteriaceae bacterium]
MREQSAVGNLQSAEGSQQLAKAIGNCNNSGVFTLHRNTEYYSVLHYPIGI